MLRLQKKCGPVPSTDFASSHLFDGNLGTKGTFGARSLLRSITFLCRNATIASETSASVGVQTACSLQVPFAVKWELICGWYTGPSWVGCVLHLVGYSEDEPLRVDAVPVMHHIALCLVAIIYIHQGAESIICIVINNIVFIRCRSC